jgi:voltage-gated potassium channel
VVAHWTFREALLQVILIFSTLGGQVRPDSTHVALMQWFDIFYILAILLVVIWGVSLLIEATVRGELVYYWGARRMQQRISALKKHYIICGFGRMGQEIARELARDHEPFVVIEHNQAQLPGLEEAGYLYVEGDARDDEQLLHAGVQRAQGLIAVYPTDEENVFITLSARVLNPALYIVTRSSHAESEAKLIRAGADRVFSPYIIGGRRMAQAILQPSVVEFLETVVHGEQMDLVMEEATVGMNADVCGHPLDGGTDVERLGVHLLGIATREGRMLMRDLQSYCPQPGDTFILLGDPRAIEAAVQMVEGEGEK